MCCQSSCADEDCLAIPHSAGSTKARPCIFQSDRWSIHGVQAFCGTLGHSNTP